MLKCLTNIESILTDASPILPSFPYLIDPLTDNRFFNPNQYLPSFNSYPD